VRHTVVIDGTRVHRFQRVREGTRSDNPFTEDETTLWTVCGFPIGEANRDPEESSDDDSEFPDGHVLLKDAGVWSRSKKVPFEDFASERYEPLTLADGQPYWWY
jgi:hypothetical protein